MFKVISTFFFIKYALTENVYRYIQFGIRLILQVQSSKQYNFAKSNEHLKKNGKYKYYIFSKMYYKMVLHKSVTNLKNINKMDTNYQSFKGTFEQFSIYYK